MTLILEFAPTRFYAIQLLSAFQYMHEADIIHRDLKIENIMFDDDAKLKLIDFGLSGDIAGKKHLETHCGSMAYVHP